MLLTEHIGGDLALLRMRRFRSIMPLHEKLAAIFKARRAIDSDAVCREILSQRLSLDTLPGTAELHAASWENNSWVGVDNDGNIVSYERIGTIEPDRLLTKFPLERYVQWEVYRREARGMLLNLLSLSTKRVVGYTNVIDVRGVTVAHRKLMPYAKEFISGDAAHSQAAGNAGAFIVGAGRAATII